MKITFEKTIEEKYFWCYFVLGRISYFLRLNWVLPKQKNNFHRIMWHGIPELYTRNGVDLWTMSIRNVIPLNLGWIGETEKFLLCHKTQVIWYELWVFILLSHGLRHCNVLYVLYVWCHNSKLYYQNNYMLL